MPAKDDVVVSLHPDPLLLLHHFLGLYSVELNRSSNPIRGYYTAVGNDALRHYQETYVDSGTDGTPLVGIPGSFHQFAATSDTTDCFSLGPNIANVILVGPGQTAAVYLTWDDTFGAATTDFDLFIFENGTNILVDFSVNDNPAIGDPVEVVAFTNNDATSKFYDIFIQNFQNASSEKTFDMFVPGGGIGLGCSAGTVFNYNTLSSSVAVHGDAGGGVVSVGAIDASDPGIDDIESFSSRGPTDNGVTKPDVTAIDGVSVTGSGGFSATFFGTSAAAPHVAGMAALLLDFIPGLLAGEEGDDPAADRAALRAAILDTAIDLGDSGVDNTYGSGRVNGLSAGQSLVEVVSIAVTPDSPSKAEGLTQQFTATGTFTDSTTQDLTATVAWTSSATTVATISSTGLATAVGQGTTTITATSDGIPGSTVLTVTVAELQSIAVTPANPSLAEGQAQQFTATGTFTDGATQNLTATAAWTSSNTAVATIIDSTGLATAVGEGTTVITATSAGVQGSTALIVGEAALQVMAVTPETPSIAKGLSLQFTATGTFTDDSSLDLTTAATWTSSTTTVATIGSTGLVTAVGQGTTTITATSAGVSGSTVFTVTPIELVSIAVTPDSPSQVEGLTQQFTATFTDSTTQDLTPTAAWTSSATTVATISSTGLATAVGVGTTTIIATSDGISGSTVLTVTAAPPVPSVSAWGLIAMASALGVFLVVRIRRRAHIENRAG